MRESVRLKNTIELSDLKFDELYDQISNNWQRRARDLQTRRWKIINNELKD